MLGKREDRKSICTRYDQCTRTFMSAICITATVNCSLNLLVWT
jgi:hypothetical protein